MGSHRQQAQAEAAWDRTGSAGRAPELEKKPVAAAERKQRDASAAPASPAGGAVDRSDVKLAVGEVVVYGNHGIGRVVARRQQAVLDDTREVVVLEFDELTVTLPLTLAQAQLRPVADEADLRLVGDALRHDCALSPRNWLSRRRETLEKLIGGTPVELAQIVSEGAQRERMRSANGRKGQLSLSERELNARARTLLSEEIALALGVRSAAAETWIDGHLVRPG